MDRGLPKCKHAYENLVHFASCQSAGRIFVQLRALVLSEDRTPTTVIGIAPSSTERESFALFGTVTRGKPLEEGWMNFHLLLWKYLIYQLTIVETEDARFQIKDVWQAALQRFKSKTLAKQASLRTDALRAESRGWSPPDLSKKGKCLQPLATVSKDGEIVWNEPLINRIEALTK